MSILPIRGSKNNFAVNDFAKMECRETRVQRRELLPLLTLTLPYHAGVAQRVGGSPHFNIQSPPPSLKLPATYYFYRYAGVA